MKVAKKKPPWKKQRPKIGKKIKLSEDDKAAARARAARAGRRYPNLVDNMWAAKRKKDRGGEAA
jgi:hypothetical protein